MRRCKRLRRLVVLLVLGIASQRLGVQRMEAQGLLASTAQEQASFLAGLPLPKQSPLYPLQQPSEYRQHQKELQEQWTFCRRIRYETMQQWGRDHLARYAVTRGVLRYLFGGPDFLNAYAFFPDTRVMVLGGLEPVGEVPPPEALPAGALAPALKALREAIHTSLFCGYFITSEMRPQLVQGSFQGVLPVLYTELALTGNIIQSVTMVRPFGAPGVQIIYHRSGGPEQTLYYFKADLSNGKECANFLSWLGELGDGCTYLKAASYLLPLSAFSETRDFLLRTSQLILQDDSGIPFRSFTPGDWHIQLFGVYTEPLEIFKLHREPELEAAYHSPLLSGSLEFGAGYHVNANDANLLLAIKNNGNANGYDYGHGGIPSGVQKMEVLGVTAPPARAAFSEPTPRPTPIQIRKALPVTIRKAIPVRTPKPKKSDVISEPIKSAPAVISAPLPQQITDAPRQKSASVTPALPSAPLTEMPLAEPTPRSQQAPIKPSMEEISAAKAPVEEVSAAEVPDPKTAQPLEQNQVREAPSSLTIPELPLATPEPSIAPIIPMTPTTSDGKPID